MKQTVVSNNDNGQQKVFLLSLPIELFTIIFSFLDEESFLVACTTCRYFFDTNAFYKKRLSDIYNVKVSKRSEMVEKYGSESILSEYLTYKMFVVYSQAKDFYLPEDRRHFLYLQKLPQNTAFAWNILCDISRLGNLPLLLELSEKYQKDGSSQGISVLLHSQILENAVKRGNIAFLEKLLDLPFPFRIDATTLAIVAESGHAKLMEKLYEKHSEELLSDYAIIDNNSLRKILSAFIAEGVEIDFINKTLEKYPINLSITSIKTLIITAARSGRIDLLDQLRAKYPQRVTTSEVLDAFAEYGHLDLVKQFLESYYVNPTENTLNVGALSGNLSLVQWLIEKYLIKHNDYRVENLIKHVTRSGNIELVQWFTSTYPDALKDDLMQDVLSEAFKSENLRLFKLLTEKYRSFWTVSVDIFQKIFVSMAPKVQVGFLRQFFEEYSHCLEINQGVINRSAKAKNYYVTSWLNDIYDPQKNAQRYINN